MIWLIWRDLRGHFKIRRVVNWLVICLYIRYQVLNDKLYLGNFHISSHAYGHLLNQIYHVAGIKTIDLSHKINHISFGEEKDLAQIRRKFKRGVLNPLDGSERIKNIEDLEVGIMY